MPSQSGSEPLRIIQTHYQRGWGGEPEQILILLEGLRNRGHQVLLAAPEDGILFARAQEKGIPTAGGLEFLLLVLSPAA